MPNVIASFWGKYRFLSNFYASPMEVRNVGTKPVQRVTTVEHLFQAMKTRDPNEQQTILEAKTPGEAKRLGRTCDLREDWEDIKLHVMRMAVKEKFRQNPNLATKLIATDELRLIEGNTWGDQFWGVDAKTGRGLNHLGRILMDVREDLKT